MTDITDISGIETIGDDNNNSNVVDFLSFPSNLKHNTELYRNCLHFTCVDPIVTGGVQSMATSYREGQLNYSSNTSNTAKSSETHLLDIYLYKPAMQTKWSHNYEPVKNSIIDNIIKGIVGATSASPDGKESGGTSKTSDVGILDKAAGAVDGLQSSIQGSAGKFIAETLSSSQQQTKGQAFITPSAAMYKGTSVRTQTFNFKFNPRNVKDLQEMAQIIYYFHYFSLPTFQAPDALNDTVDPTGNSYKTQGSAWYDVPKMWYIDEMFGSIESNQAKRYTPRFIFGPAAITNLEYNMTPDDFSKTLKGTAADPVAVDLSITFTELIPMDSEMYNAQNKNTEVHNLGPTVNKHKSKL